MTKEYRLLGPPGTGKTRWITRQVANAARRYRPNEIYLTSFTRASALEIANRVPMGSVAKDNIGTIHAICYRYLGCPEVAEAHLTEWNEKHKTFQAACSGASIEDPYIYTERRQSHLAELNKWRGCGKSVEDVKGDMSEFVRLWTEWKEENGLLDFSDILDMAPDTLPGGKVLIVDEAQDLTPKQWQIVRRWGEHCDVFCTAGDEDQCLYGFIGANPASMMTELPPENVKVLHQSYRVPKAIHSVANRWIQRLGDRRNEKAYNATEDDGVVMRGLPPLNDPESLLGYLLRDTEAFAEEGRNAVMVLTSCSHFLTPLVRHMKDAGIPFHNPYRTKRFDWNPLGRKETAQRVASFWRCHRALAENDERAIRNSLNWQWVQLLAQKGVMSRGTHDLFLQGDIFDDYILWATARMEVSAIRAMRTGDWDFLRSNLKAALKTQGVYCIELFKKRGIEALAQTPRIVVGTIHSVKGGEANAVYLSPDLSSATVKEIDAHGIEAEDAVRRMAYVGMTRARKKLALLEPSSKHYWEA